MPSGMVGLELDVTAEEIVDQQVRSSAILPCMHCMACACSVDNRGV
jgi:hypothetical protein